MGSTRPPPSLSTYGFGIVRAEDAPARRAILTELCEVMSAALGAIFVAHVAPTYQKLGAALESGQIAFAWMPPLLVLDLEQRHAALPVVLPLRRGSTASFYSAIVTRIGGPRSIPELAGKRAVWVEHESTSGYILPRIHLGLAGFDPKSFASEELAHSHDGVVSALASGRADVGATFCTLDARTNRIAHGAWTSPDGTTKHALDVLATIGPIPNDAVVAGARVPADLRERMAQWLLAMDSRRAREITGGLLRAEGFVRSMPSHYDPLRAILAEARARGLYQGPSVVSAKP